MRRADQLLKTMSALRLCLEKCRHAPAPFEALEDRLRELRQNPDLTSEDLAQIETLARKALAACAGSAGGAKCG
jgi:hypothetical protein